MKMALSSSKWRFKKADNQILYIFLKVFLLLTNNNEMIQLSILSYLKCAKFENNCWPSPKSVNWVNMAIQNGRYPDFIIVPKEFKLGKPHNNNNNSVQQSYFRILVKAYLV